MSRSSPPASPASRSLASQVERMRQFNRFYTHRIGVLVDGRLYAPFSLAETRVLYELAHRDHATASDLVRDLGLDAGYLSRMLRGFEKKGFIRRQAAPQDARQSLLSLTRAGHKAFAPTEEASRRVLRPLLERLDAPARGRVTAAMETLEALLGDAPASKPAYSLRPHRPGDMGWVIAAHARLYAEDYGWDISFEALVAEIAAKFLRDFDPACERCWIAELNGEPVGSVFVVRQSRTVAKLRLLIVDPKARGLGLGHRLVQECIDFSRVSGYRKLMLWTNSVLTAARAIYVQAGFTLVESAPHRSFGQDLVGETWERKL